MSASNALGAPTAFFGAVLIIALWLGSGPFFHFSDSWQLFINTGTTIVTFLMVFLIQNTQTRDARAFHLKLDELIRAHGRARNELIELQNLSDVELEKLAKEFEALRLARNAETERQGSTP